MPNRGGFTGPVSPETPPGSPFPPIFHRGPSGTGVACGLEAVPGALLVFAVVLSQWEGMQIVLMTVLWGDRGEDYL